MLRWLLGRDISVMPSAWWTVARIAGMGVGVMMAEVASVSWGTAAAALPPPSAPALSARKPTGQVPSLSQVVVLDSPSQVLGPAPHGFREEFHIPLSVRI